LIEREFINTNKNIYKIGRTKKANLERFNQYPKQSILLFQIKCLDCVIAETNLKQIFSNKFIKHPEIGSEYFQGNVNEMIDIIYGYLKKPQQTEETIQPQNKEKIDYNVDNDKVVPKNSITITDEKIINFFETHFMDPTKFIQNAIDNYQLTTQNVSTNNSLESPKNSSEITKTDLIKFQNEYNTFINQKKTLINAYRETTKQLESMDLECLDSYLCNNFGVKRDIFNCMICNKNSYRSKKALSTHQRKCKKDNEITTCEEIEEE
jgi:hypothetical protein